MKGIGYREFVEYYNGTQTLEETRLRVVKSTLNLAKRQRTWFKRNNSIRWVNEQSEAIDILTTFLNN
jgi:tRNA dimethylallyltransferase